MYSCNFFVIIFVLHLKKKKKKMRKTFIYFILIGLIERSNKSLYYKHSKYNLYIFLFVHRK